MRLRVHALLCIACLFRLASADEPPTEKQPDAAEVRAVLEAAIDVFGGAVVGNQFEQQFLPQFRRILATELRFVRTVCQTTPEQQKSIQAAGEAVLKSTVKKFGALQQKAGMGQVQQEWPDPRKLISDAIAESVKKTLAAEQVERYEAELAKRVAARKRAALVNLVAKVDRELILTAEQRDQLSKALEADWKDAWAGQLEVFLYGEDFLPVVPDAVLLPVLTDKQKAIWKATPRTQHMIGGWAGFGMGFFGDIGIDVDVPVDAVPADAPAEATP